MNSQSIRGMPDFNWEISLSSKGKVVLVFDLPEEAQPSFITVEGIATIRLKDLAAEAASSLEESALWKEVAARMPAVEAAGSGGTGRTVQDR